MTFNHTISNGSRKTERIRQRLLMPGITRNFYRFFAWIIAQNSRKFFNCRTKFNSIKSNTWSSGSQNFTTTRRKSHLILTFLRALIPSSLKALKLFLVLKSKLRTHLLISWIVEWEKLWFLAMDDVCLWLLCFTNLYAEICAKEFV